MRARGRLNVTYFSHQLICGIIHLKYGWLHEISGARTQFLKIHRKSTQNKNISIDTQIKLQF